MSNMSRDYEDSAHSHQRVMCERVYEQHVRVPKRIVTEELVEEVVVQPKKVVREHIMEEAAVIRERVIEVAKPVLVERVVEVPEVEYIEKVIEVPQEVIQERITEVPVVQYQDRYIDVPRYVEEFEDEIEYRPYDVERTVEVLTYKDEVVDREVPCDQVVEVEVPEYRDVDVPVLVERRIPVGVASCVSHHFKLPRLKPRYKKVPLPIYAPRFIEVPVPFTFMNEEQKDEAKKMSECMQLLAANEYPSLTEIEKLAEAAKAKKFTFLEDRNDLAAVLHKQVNEGHLTCDVTPRPVACFP